MYEHYPQVEPSWKAVLVTHEIVDGIAETNVVPVSILDTPTVVGRRLHGVVLYNGNAHFIGRGLA